MAECILVTGATGYIGGRLVPRLLEKGYAVRCLARDPARLQGRAWSDRVEGIKGDVTDALSLEGAFDGVEAAYYMVHSMGDTAAFHERDLTAAKNFSEAAARSGVKRIVYLGGLGDSSDVLSEHLRSRQQTGEALRSAGVPVTEFRAAIVVGSGSVSFEMIRNLTERLPVMVCPSWVFNRVQPIAVRNVLDYLVEALSNDESSGQIIEIGGKDVITYGQMMTQYAEVRGLRRFLIPVPVLTPRLSSYWVHWTTPIPAEIARPLIDGLKNEVFVQDARALALFPDVALFDYRTAVSRALDRLDDGDPETWWSDAIGTSLGDVAPVQMITKDGMVMERRTATVEASPARVFETFSGIGGQRGWLCANWLWEIRGLIDRTLGGAGLRRGRRDPDHLRVGDAVDFWRVEDVRPDRSIRLRAEMKVPGNAWLEFDVEPVSEGVSRLNQCAYFAPKGLFGLAYWYALYPIHRFMFSGMIARLKILAEGKTAS
jgi:uncharacterized protein YbjT (DUF2867 family)